MVPAMSALTRTLSGPGGAMINRIIPVWPSSVRSLAPVVAYQMTRLPSLLPVATTEVPPRHGIKADVDAFASPLLKTVTLSFVDRYTRQASFPVETKKLEPGSNERLVIG